MKVRKLFYLIQFFVGIMQAVAQSDSLLTDSLFQIAFKGQVSQTRFSKEIDNENIVVTTYRSSTSDSTVYNLTYIYYPASFLKNYTQDQISVMFSSAINNTVIEMDAEIESEGKLNFESYMVWQDFTINLEEDTRKVKTRFILHGRSFYSLQVNFKSNKSDRLAQKFFESFVLSE